MGSRMYDVAVVGAGVFGAWTAFHLARAGKRVLIVDQHGPGNSRASSGGETRIIRMSYGADEIYTRSSIRSLKLWKKFFPSMFVKTGVLVTAPRSDPYLIASRDTLTRARYKFEWIARPSHPRIVFDAETAAIHEPGSGVLLARRAVQAVVEAAVQAGARYERWRIDAPDPQLARIFVFACGPWLPKLFRDVIGRRIRPTRQEVFFFGMPPDEPPMPCWIAFREGAYTIPPVDGRGFKLAIDEHGPVFDPENGDRSVSRASVERARSILRRRFPAYANAPLLETRVCQYENTSNGDFLIDRHPGFENVWLAGGGSGHGFKHGPWVGEYVTRVLAGGHLEPRFSLASKSLTAQRSVY
jgi:glycine/D-amino acid oxidase-like deaminating enzyme